MDRLIEKAKILSEALPYIRLFRGERVVIKYGGAAMLKPELKETVIKDIVLLSYVGIKPVVVHGGGPEISQLMERLGMKAEFVEGLRVTDKETLAITEMVLVGKLSGEIVRGINREGGCAVALSGKDANLIMAEKMGGQEEGRPELGYVGTIRAVNPGIIELLEQKDHIPVVAPLGVDENGQAYNINADMVASSMAVALKARKLILLTDTRGIYREEGKEDSFIPSLHLSEAKKLLQQEAVSGGMKPKLIAAIEALEGGVRKAHIIDGRLPHALLLELFTVPGIGTEILAKPA